MTSKKYGHTEECNGVGFNRLDSNILSSFAEQILEGRNLSPKQLLIARIRLEKICRSNPQLHGYKIQRNRKGVKLWAERK